MTRTTPRRAVGAAGLAALATAAVLAGCSGDDPSASADAQRLGDPALHERGASSSGARARARAPSAGASPTESPSETAAVPTVAEVYRAARTAALSAASGHAEGSQTREGRTLKIDVEGTGERLEPDRLHHHAKAARPRCSPSVTPTGSAATRRSGSSRPATRPPARGWSASTCRSPSPTRPSSGSFTLRSILTEKFALPEFAAFESDSGAGAGDRARRARGLRARRRGRRPPVGGERRQRHPAAGGRAEDGAVRPRLLRLGPRRDVHRRRRPRRSSRTAEPPGSPGVRSGWRPGRVGCGASGARAATSRSSSHASSATARTTSTGAMSARSDRPNDAAVLDRRDDRGAGARRCRC